MTSRETVVATLEGKSVDRVASDFRAETEVFEKLQNYLVIDGVEDVLLWTKSDFRDVCFLFNDGGYDGYSSFDWRDIELEQGVFEDFMVDLLSDEKAARYIIEGNWRFFHDYTNMMLEAGGGCVDAVGMYDDFGNQLGMMISLELYRRYFKEYQRDYIKMAKTHGAYVFYHSCGGISGILEDLLEIGVDILDPLQLNAMGFRRMISSICAATGLLSMEA